MVSAKTQRAKSLKKAKLFIPTLVISGLLFLVQAGWIPAKAFLAYGLLDASADKAAHSKMPEKPWSWADFGVIGRLKFDTATIPVLDRATGQALAFGSGRHEEFKPGEGPTVISGHRDTHFSLLEHIKADTVFIYEELGKNKVFRVLSTHIHDTREGEVIAPQKEQILLVTCWPFGGIDTRTTKRFVVLAEEIDPSSASVSVTEKVQWPTLWQKLVIERSFQLRSPVQSIQPLFQRRPSL